MTFKQFVLSCLSEPGVVQKGETSISFGRCITLLIVVCVMTWDSAYVFYAMKFHLVPVLPEATALLGQLAFMTAFYGMNKAAGTYQAVAGTTPAPAAQPEQVKAVGA